MRTTIADLQRRLACTLWGQAAAARGLDAAALARPMATALWLARYDPHGPRSYGAVGLEMHLEPRRAYQLATRARRLLMEGHPACTPTTDATPRPPGRSPRPARASSRVPPASTPTLV